MLLLLASPLAEALASVVADALVLTVAPLPDPDPATELADEPVVGPLPGPED